MFCVIVSQNLRHRVEGQQSGLWRVIGYSSLRFKLRIDVQNRKDWTIVGTRESYKYKNVNDSEN